MVLGLGVALTGRPWKVVKSSWSISVFTGKETPAGAVADSLCNITFSRAVTLPALVYHPPRVAGFYPR